jgi:hypothetical protein
VFDNERWAHEVRVPEFEIAQPVTWAQHGTINDRYEDARWWSDAAGRGRRKTCVPPRATSSRCAMECCRGAFGA